MNDEDAKRYRRARRWDFLELHTWRCGPLYLEWTVTR
jgi:hypothetical protein